MTEVDREWDIFLSYASEDRDAVARPLHDLLTSFGVRVWYDKTELRVGDSLRERIDFGLARSRFGVVILSKNFFAKHYPQRELNGLANREIDGRKVLLPVWHDISAEEVRTHSPPLADRIALLSADSLESVAAALLMEVRPDLAEEIEKEFHAIRTLPEIQTGKQLWSVFADVHAHQEFTDEVESADEADLIGGFLDGLREFADFAEDLTPQQVLNLQLQYNDEIATLWSAGWSLFADRRVKSIQFPDGKSPWQVATVAIVRRAKAVLVLRDGKVMVVR